jgi:(p)ppGpp synthase/HD superfamily hydrolase
MIYSPLTYLAMRIAYDAHNGVLDKSGAPYIFHPYEVASRMDDEISTAVALLHDVIEDTDFNASDLRKFGFTPVQVDAVVAITRKKDEKYFDYIARLKQNDLARMVKMADLKHNSDKSRLLTLPQEEQEQMLKLIDERYKKALKMLKE